MPALLPLLFLAICTHELVGDTLSLCPSLGLGFTVMANRAGTIEPGPHLRSEYKNMSLVSSFNINKQYDRTMHGGDSAIDSFIVYPNRIHSDIHFDVMIGYSVDLNKFLTLLPGLRYSYREFEYLNVNRNYNTKQSYLSSNLSEVNYLLFPNGRDIRYEISIGAALWKALYYRFNYSLLSNVPLYQSIGYSIQSRNTFSFMEYSWETSRFSDSKNFLHYFRSGVGFYIKKNSWPNCKDKDNSYEIKSLAAICSTGWLFLFYLIGAVLEYGGS